jgi:hypothetical protein
LAAKPERAAGRHWPWGIAIGLAIVVVINALFAFIAVRGADSVVPSYTTEAR